MVKHEPRRLIGLLVARGDEPGPATLRLRPRGTAAGRLVDGDGKPRAGVRLQVLGARPGKPAAGHVRPVVRTDSEGRFLIDELIGGLTYDVRILGLIDGTFDVIEGTAAEGLSVGSGERKDLGDLRAGTGRRDD